MKEAAGASGRVSIRLWKIPCRLDPDSGKRRFTEPDFGSRLLDELFELHLGDFDQLRDQLASGREIHGKLVDNLFNGMEFSLASPAPPEYRRQLESDIADALIECFHSVGIRAN